jgi:RimJ/RimL family protein N-acetyltransferase
MIELLTPHLRLRQFTEADFEPLAAMNADPEAMRYTGFGGALERWQSWNSLAAILGHWQLRGYGTFCVEERGGASQFAGRVGVNDFTGYPGFEIGWMIARPLWGRGYATEAAEAVRDWAFQTLGRDHAIHLIRPANLASQAVARKLGAHIERQMTFHGHTTDVWRTDRGSR